MKYKEILPEAKMDPGIKRHMIKKGYKFLGRGQDQDVYLEPGTGLVLKIFGTDYEANHRGNIRLSTAQQSFKDFADFCHKNQGNEFLPYFSGWETFVFKDKLYLQIRTERLFPWGGSNSDISFALEYIVQLISERKTFDWYIRSFDTKDVNASTRQHQLLTLIGEDGLKLLWGTIEQLNRLAKSRGYALDLHSDNFMLSSEGLPVINDPFFTGSWRE